MSYINEETFLQYIENIVSVNNYNQYDQSLLVKLQEAKFNQGLVHNDLIAFFTSFNLNDQGLEVVETVKNDEIIQSFEYENTLLFKLLYDNNNKTRYKHYRLSIQDYNIGIDSSIDKNNFYKKLFFIHNTNIEYKPIQIKKTNTFFPFYINYNCKYQNYNTHPSFTYLEENESQQQEKTFSDFFTNYKNYYCIDNNEENLKLNNSNNKIQNFNFIFNNFTWLKKEDIKNLYYKDIEFLGEENFEDITKEEFKSKLDDKKQAFSNFIQDATTLVNAYNQYLDEQGSKGRLQLIPRINLETRPIDYWFFDKNSLRNFGIELGFAEIEYTNDTITLTLRDNSTSIIITDYYDLGYGDLTNIIKDKLGETRFNGLIGNITGYLKTLYEPEYLHYFHILQESPEVGFLNAIKNMPNSESGINFILYYNYYYSKNRKFYSQYQLSSSEEDESNESLSSYITLNSNINEFPLSIGKGEKVEERGFRIDWDGNTYINNGHLNGEIHATSGQIGNWIIDNNGLTNGTSTLDADGNLYTDYITLKNGLGYIGFYEGSNTINSTNVLALSSSTHNISIEVNKTVKAESQEELEEQLNESGTTVALKGPIIWLEGNIVKIKADRIIAVSSDNRRSQELFSYTPQSLTE